jgi:hypothetical protein
MLTNTTLLVLGSPSQQHLLSPCRHSNAHRSSSPRRRSNAHRRLARRKDMDDSDARSSNWQRNDARYVRGVNWALDSEDDMDAYEATDATSTLLQLASMEAWRLKVHHEMVELLLPIMHPLVYGDHEDDVNDAAATLLWIGRGYVYH